ncbi:MAG: prepilin-type N-terminal cleavage/methylation domain-containing protein [Elusimicrobiota bacterium]|jgi:prepilin-type N-terminal cleavage/methylation domain-containing protein|nr:prepilin-type N-terminal cleavage/methylation domain-containing protein [Elusimicrobiota bacterium]
MKKLNNAGFNLVEVLVVVLVMGLLAAIALPQYRKSLVRTELAEAVMLVKVLADSTKMYQYVHDDNLPCRPGQGNTAEFNKLDVSVDFDKLENQNDNFDIYYSNCEAVYAKYKHGGVQIFTPIGNQTHRNSRFINRIGCVETDAEAVAKKLCALAGKIETTIERSGASALYVLSH